MILTESTLSIVNAEFLSNSSYATSTDQLRLIFKAHIYSIVAAHIKVIPPTSKTHVNMVRSFDTVRTIIRKFIKSYVGFLNSSKLNKKELLDTLITLSKSMISKLKTLQFKGTLNDILTNLTDILSEIVDKEHKISIDNSHKKLSAILKSNFR